MMIDFKQSRTMKEWLLITPQTFFDRAAFVMLTCWCTLPVFLMLCNLMMPFIKHDVNRYVMMSVGSSGIALGLISFAKTYLQSENRSIRHYIKRHPEHILLLGMLAWGFVSCFFAENIFKAFTGNYYRTDGFISYIFYAGFFSAVVVLKSECLRKVLLNIIVATATVLSAITLLQFNGVKVRVFINYNAGLASIFENSNHFGYYLAMSIIICALMFVVCKSIKAKTIYALQYIIMCLTLFANDTLGCYIAVSVALIISTVVLFFTNKKFAINALIAVACFVALSAAFDVKYGFISRNLKSLVGDTSKIITESDDSAGTNRWGLWKDAIYFIGNRPVFGYGIENMQEAYEGYKPMEFDRPHNEYLQHAVFMGIPALLLYIASLTVIFVRAIRHRKQLNDASLIAVCATGAYLISAFFGNTMFYTTPYFIIVLAMSSCSYVKDFVHIQAETLQINEE